MFSNLYKCILYIIRSRNYSTHFPIILFPQKVPSKFFFYFRVCLPCALFFYLFLQNFLKNMFSIAKTKIVRSPLNFIILLLCCHQFLAQKKKGRKMYFLKYVLFEIRNRWWFGDKKSSLQPAMWMICGCLVYSMQYWTIFWNRDWVLDFLGPGTERNLEFTVITETQCTFEGHKLK
jgi:hypothetical protein